MAESEKQPPVPAAAPDTGAAEDLSQADIDRLVAEASVTAAATSRPPAYRCNGERFGPAESPRIEAYDFSDPVVIEEHVLRVLRQRHEELAAFVSARLSIFLRLDLALRLQRVSVLAYRRFASLVPDPNHVVLFKLEPLPGVGVLDIDTKFGLSFVERLLGGRGVVAHAPDGLSEIETNLLDDILLVILEEWCRLWGGAQRLTPGVVGHESGGRYLQTSAADTPVLLVGFEGSFGEATGRIQFAMPYASLEGHLRSLVAARLVETTASAPAPRRPAAWTQAFNGIPIPLSVEWDACEISLREIVALAPGTVLQLPRDILRDTRVRLSGATKFVGEVGIDQDRLAVRVDRKVSPEDV